jgi:transcriptional regulator with XRE-family HTH domain
MKLQREAVVFGERLRELREKRGETVRSLADQMGMSFAYLSEMERGVKVPSLTTIIRLAIALDCKVTDLVDVFNRRNLRALVPPTK